MGESVRHAGPFGWTPSKCWGPANRWAPSLQFHPISMRVFPRHGVSGFRFWSWKVTGSPGRSLETHVALAWKNASGPGQKGILILKKE